MRLFVALVVLALALAVLAQFDFPCAVEAPGKVLAAREWAVVKGQDGHLESSLRDHLRGGVSYTVRHVERGDEARFELHPGFRPGAWVEAGDTLGWFYSSETERQQAQLQAELASAAAGLELARAGEKEAVVREARQRLALAQAEWAQQRRQLARLQALLNQQMIEAETVERAQHAAAIQALQVEVAQAQLEAVSSGDREAQVALARARLEGARRQAEVLARRQRAGTLLAPLAGKLQGALSTDTLLVVRDLSRFALLVPVKWRDRGLLSPGQAVEVHTDTGPLPGVLEALDQALYPLEGEQVFFATVLAEGRSGELAPGLLVRCRIPCAPVGLVGYLKRFLLG